MAQNEEVLKILDTVKQKLILISYGDVTNQGTLICDALNPGNFIKSTIYVVSEGTFKNEGTINGENGSIHITCARYQNIGEISPAPNVIINNVQSSHRLNVTKLKEMKSRGNICYYTGEECEIYSEVNKRWIKGEIVDLITDDQGVWLKVKCGRTAQELPLNDERIRGITSRVKWHNLVEAVNQELYPLMATSLGLSVDELIDAGTLNEDDLSDEATDKVIQRMKNKKVLYSTEIEYIKDLVKRANAFQWDATESMCLGHFYFLIILRLAFPYRKCQFSSLCTRLHAHR